MEFREESLILLLGVEEGVGPRTPDRAFTSVMFWLGLAMVPIWFMGMPPGPGPGRMPGMLDWARPGPGSRKRRRLSSINRRWSHCPPP